MSIYNTTVTTNHIKRASSENYKVATCRICASRKLYSFLSLGSMPIPNGFLSKEDLKIPESYYPLGVCVCQECWLVQLTQVVPAKIMFRNYLYVPSTSTTMLSHFKSLASEIIKMFHLNSSDRVVDVGSNDGTLLSYFKNEEIDVLGIDPATNLAQLARLNGIDTINDFFTAASAKRIAAKVGKASVITGTNVLAHVDDLHDFCRGLDHLLKKDGVFVCEFPYGSRVD